MTIDTITNPLIDFVVRVISHKFYQSSRFNSVPYIAVDMGYKIVKKDHTYDLTELQLQQLMENLGAIRKTKSAQCKFGSILVCIFFYVQNTFPSFRIVGWKTNRSVAIEIGEYIEQLGENFESLMTSDFEDFKQSMQKRLRIPVSLVEKHYDDVYFLVDVDYTFVQDATPRVRWLRPLSYEINVDETSAAISALLVEEVDKSAKIFGNYELKKSKITMELKTTLVIKKKDRMVKKIKAKFGEGVEQKEEDSQAQAPLSLT